ncbi:hypothetical protein PanWU01x14_015690 [Parasponia andersonii]|uniref:Uncharacterized protein n=1 Tax=Parasponia andersonii TaxID=3476 RepID=A0A2P5E0L8_PARAD|nr:hypothetical protein PanWU01x14_015690 [Parasponia andersonii]
MRRNKNHIGASLTSILTIGLGFSAFRIAMTGFFAKKGFILNIHVVFDLMGQEMSWAKNENLALMALCKEGILEGSDRGFRFVLFVTAKHIRVWESKSSKIPFVS